jgi:dienelactone hydrolase
MVPLCGCGVGGDLGGAPTPPPATEPEEVALEASDGVALAGTWQAAPGVQRGLGALLLHQVMEPNGPAHDRHDFDPVRDDLLAAGVSILTLDLRSHGASGEATTALVNLSGDRDQLPLDVRAGLDFLDRQGHAVDPAQVGVVGLGLGASLALVAVHESYDELPPDWGARSAVAVSARADRVADLNADGTAVHDLALRDCALIAGAEHAADAADAELLHDEVRGTSRLVLIDGSAAHGADLLAEEPEVGRAIVEWFTDTWTPEDP